MVFIGIYVKSRYKKDCKGNFVDWVVFLFLGLVVIFDKLQFSKKYKIWYEVVENKNKKKRFEFEVIGLCGLFVCLLFCIVLDIN